MGETPLDLEAPWGSAPLIVWDFESTGVDPLTCGAVSYGVVRFESRVEVASDYGLINPQMAIPEGASAIHGIRQADVDGAPCLKDALAGMPAALSLAAVPVAFNAGYDRAILLRHVNDPTVPAYDHNQLWICPLTIIRDVDRWQRGTGRHKLETVCKRRGVPLDGAHNALSDARATGLLLLSLLASGEVKNCPLGKLLRHLERRRVSQAAEFSAWLAKQPKREGVPQ